MAATVAILAILASCGGEPVDDGTVPSSQPPASTTLLWRDLGAWTGRGDRQTESFEVSSGALRLTWSAQDEDEPGAGTLRVSLHSAISGRPLEQIVDHVGVGSDTLRVTAGPRVAYLLVESRGLAWSVGLEEGVATGATALP